MNNWWLYELEKRKLQEKNLTWKEYQKELKKLAKRLGI
jgi:hypothetical protein